MQSFSQRAKRNFGIIIYFSLIFKNFFFFSRISPFDIPKRRDTIIRHRGMVDRDPLSCRYIPLPRCFISGEEYICARGQIKEEGETLYRNGVKWRGTGDNLRSTIRPYNGDNVPHPTHAPFSTANIHPFTDVSHSSLLASN